MIARSGDCVFCKECMYEGEDLRKKAEDNLAITVQHSNECFKFKLESTGALEPKQIVMDALEVLANKLKRIKHAASRLAMV